MLFIFPNPLCVKEHFMSGSYSEPSTLYDYLHY